MRPIQLDLRDKLSGLLSVGSRFKRRPEHGLQSMLRWNESAALESIYRALFVDLDEVISIFKFLE